MNSMNSVREQIRKRLIDARGDIPGRQLAYDFGVHNKIIQSIRDELEDSGEIPPAKRGKAGRRVMPRASAPVATSVIEEVIAAHPKASNAEIARMARTTWNRVQRVRAALEEGEIPASMALVPTTQGDRIVLNLTARATAYELARGQLARELVSPSVAKEAITDVTRMIQSLTQIRKLLKETANA